MRKKLLKIIWGIAACTAVHSAKAQSATAYSSNFVGAGGAAEVADTLYLGPGLFELEGDWEIFSEYILIDPNATFAGAGTFKIMNPGAFTGTSVSTKLDANNINNAIGVNIALQNDAGIQLTNLNFPTDFITVAGWSESSSATVYAGENLHFAVDGSHLLLGNTASGDLRLDASATLTGFSPNRYVVTNNSLLSHLVKENYTAAFIFPVGIATGDYTPAQISNASNNTIHVSVQDYAASPSPEALADGTINTADGMNRTWHIFADNAGISSTLTLQHNNTSNQSGFVDASHFLTQWGTTTPNSTGDFTVAYSMSPWQTNTLGSGVVGTLSSTGTVTGSSMRSRVYSSGLATTSGANQSFFTKSADIDHPLPIVLASFTSTIKDCDVTLSWEVGRQEDVLSYDLLHSRDGSNYELLTTMKPDWNNGKYAYTHPDAGNGTHFYRLHIKESNNQVSFSPTERVDLTCPHISDAPYKHNVMIYPNPASETLFITGLDFEKAHTIRLSTIDGKTLLEKSSAESNVRIDLQQFAPGNYVLEVYENKVHLLSTKIVKQ